MDVDHDVNLCAGDGRECPTSTPRRDEHAADYALDLKLCASLLHFVNEQMSSLKMQSINEYICKLVRDERARATLEQDVRREQAEIRCLSALRRQSRTRL
jgi:hypothetical protein